jgi:hypothetical protein
MKLRTILKSLVLTVVLLASTLVSYTSGAATSRCVSPASSFCPSEMKPKGIELARAGFQVGNA